MRSISVPIAGILAAAVLDHRWSWGTVASVLVAIYCHRVYRKTPTPIAGESLCSVGDELRPGWAARWGASEPGDAYRCPPGAAGVASDCSEDRSGDRQDTGNQPYRGASGERAPQGGTSREPHEAR